MYAIKKLKLGNGMVCGVPNPQPADAKVVEEAISTALREAAATGVLLNVDKQLSNQMELQSETNKNAETGNESTCKNMKSASGE